MCGIFGRFAFRAPALGHFPAVLVEGVAVLADQPRVVLVIDGDHPNRDVFKPDDTVDTRRAARGCDLGVLDANPRVLVRDFS